MARKAAADIDNLDLEEDFDDADEEEEASAKKRKSSKTKKDSEPRGVGAREVAEFLGAEPKTFRAWLRRKVASGDVELPGGHDAKTRYDFGATLDSPVVKAIKKAWDSESHEKGAGIEKAQAAKAAKAAAKKGTAKKATPKAK